MKIDISSQHLRILSIIRNATFTTSEISALMIDKIMLAKAASAFALK